MPLKSERVPCCEEGRSRLYFGGGTPCLGVTVSGSGVYNIDVKIAYCPFCGKHLVDAEPSEPVEGPISELTTHDLEVVTLKHDRDVLFEICHSLEKTNDVLEAKVTRLKEKLASVESHRDSLEAERVARRNRDYSYTNKPE